MPFWLILLRQSLSTEGLHRVESNTQSMVSETLRTEGQPLLESNRGRAWELTAPAQAPKRRHKIPSPQPVPVHSPQPPNIHVQLVSLGTLKRQIPSYLYHRLHSRRRTIILASSAAKALTERFSSTHPDSLHRTSFLREK